MRIWHYTGIGTDAAGGVETHVRSVTSALRKQGHEIEVGLEAPRAWLAPGTQGLIVHTHGDLWPNATVIARIRRDPWSRWIHVCHGTSVGRVIACREFASLSGWRGSLRDLVCARLSNAIIAVSPEALREAYLYFRVRVPASVIPNGADASVFFPLREVARAPRLAFIGRAGDRVKNTGRLLEACVRARRRLGSLELWAAPGIADPGTARNFVRNLGPLQPQALAHALAECRALVLCSLYEGDPIVLREAQSMGLPVVASDIPQIRWSLCSYPNAILVHPRDTASIERGIERALSGEIELTPQPRARDWSQVARELSLFYQAIASAPK